MQDRTEVKKTNDLTKNPIGEKRIVSLITAAVLFENSFFLNGTDSTKKQSSTPPHTGMTLGINGS